MKGATRKLMDVDLNWLSRIPVDWALMRIKDIAELRSGDAIAAEDIAPEGDYPVFGGNGLRGYTNSYTHNGHHVLIGRQGALCGNINYAKGKFWATEHAVVATLARGHDTTWFGELLRTMNLNQHSNAAAQPGLAVDRMKFLRLPVPPHAEQQRIASFLDASCAVVDAAVAAKQRQIETLETVMDAMIHEAVTHGLDKTVPLAPSRLDWLPGVPRHWDVCHIKRRCTLLRGKFTHRPRNDPALYDGEYPFVQTGDITAAQKYIRSYSQTLNELGLSVSRMFPRGTLVMSIAANVGDVAILDFEACFPDSMVGLVPDHRTELDFLYYLMRSMKGILLRSAVLTTQLNLNYVRIGTNRAPFPPRAEQKQIALFLDGKVAEARHIIDGIESQITTLTAYRKSMIHECVTGQRRITDGDVAAVLRRTAPGSGC